MKISQNGIELIKSFEGYRCQAYKCQAGVWTIGYGTTKVNGKKVKQGQTCTREQAEEYLRKDLASFEKTVNGAVKVKLTQSMYDALVSFTYNVGSFAFRTSSLLKYLNKCEYVKASNEFLKWNKVTSGGKKVVSAGLTNRRKREQKLFLSEDEKMETVDKTVSDSLNVGDKVTIKSGACDYGTGKKFASFVYKNKYNVIQVDSKKVVFGIGKNVTGSVGIENVNKVK